ncbi:TPA: phage tail family protein [Bacillus cereus]|nr:phage tail family protein [Bacillus cereus]
MITLDDKYRFEDFGFMYKPGNDDPITPDFERKTYSIPGRVGVIPFGTAIKEKHFAYPLEIIERFHSVMQRKFEVLSSFFFDEYGEPRKIKMVRDYEPDRFYYVELAKQILPDRLPEDGKLVLQLVAYDPYACSHVKSDERIKWGSKISFTTRIKFGHKASQYTVTGAQSLEVSNIGSLVVRPIVEIVGVATALTFTINGESFSFGNLNNETLFIDAATYTVIKNGKNHLFNTVGNLEKFELFPGKNTTRIGGTNLNINVKIKFQGKYK